MIEQEQTPEKKRRDWVIILIILLIGFLCVILAGGWAIRFAPTWRLDTDMGSNIDPNSDFLTNRPSDFIAPLDPSILTQPAWINVFLTPGAVFETSIPSTSLPTNTPLATNTAILTVIPPTNTLVGPSPTNTLIFFPPPTNTPKPPQPPTNTPFPVVDLAITKDDGNVSYIAGGTVTYTITVINNGPDDVIGAVITDNLPAQITTWSWACTSQNGGASGCNAVTNSSVNFSDTIDLPNGASIVYTVTANVSGSATGNLINTATIGVPAGYSDTVPGNNSSTDTDTLTTLSADLSITKDDGMTIVNNGNTVTYTVRVTNSGPDTVSGAILSDPAVAGLNKTGVLCSGTPSQCVTPPSVAQIQNGTFTLPTLTNGQFYEISISASVTATSGNVTNTATVSTPAGVNDPNTANNSASDTDAVAVTADLWIEITDYATEYTANALKLLPNTPPYAYTITVHNAGPSNVTGATVSSTFVNGNANSIGWTCTPSAGAACGAFAGVGNLNNASVDLNSGSYITFYLAAQVIASPSGSLVNTATVTAPLGVTDPNLGNNSDTDSDTLIVPASQPGQIGTNPDGSYYQLPTGQTLTLNIPVVADGDVGTYDLVIYEFDNGGTVFMDWIEIQVGDGSNWYTVFYWGDNVADTSSNINFNNFPALSPPEPDERPLVTATYFYNGPGILIDIDPFVSSGTYPYIRIKAPPGDIDGTEIDGIEILP